MVFGTDGDRDATKRVPLAKVAAKEADMLWVTDENPRTENAESIRAQLLSGIKEERPEMENVCEVTTCRRDAIRKAILAAGLDDTVIITGKGAEPYQELKGFSTLLMTLRWLRIVWLPIRIARIFRGNAC